MNLTQLEWTKTKKLEAKQDDKDLFAINSRQQGVAEKNRKTH
jgi:hypothetical protein